MLPASQRTVIGGPAFIRLLARLTGVDASPPDSSLGDRLSQWLDWKHALALSTVLDGAPVPPDGSGRRDMEHGECARLHANQVAAIAAEASGVSVVRKQPAIEGAANQPQDFAVFRQRYLARQRAMQSVTGDLRGRLRDALASQSTQAARLAEVDAAMELALSPREQALLARVPKLLERRFEQLRQAASARGPAAGDRWLGVFRSDMQSVLLAELDVRFQPVQGLLAALRTS